MRSRYTGWMIGGLLAAVAGAGAIVSVQACIETDGQPILLGAPVLLGASGEAASAFV